SGTMSSSSFELGVITLVRERLGTGPDSDELFLNIQGTGTHLSEGGYALPVVTTTPGCNQR
ncbi:MAG TPA: hypothetical protein VKR42_09990, partial [Ktedonobacteraceae bacterium]|nr:hypothetical protein [Ktedonobacteraceae bacterium]